METPNDIDGLIYGAKLDALDEMHHLVVWAYRRQVLDTLCDFVQQFVAGAATIDLGGDVGWRWTVDAIRDADGEEIEVGDEVRDLLSDLFTSRVDDFPDWETRGRQPYIDVAERIFYCGGNLFAADEAKETAA